jgi:hypothetical protein
VRRPSDGRQASRLHQLEERGSVLVFCLHHKRQPSFALEARQEVKDLARTLAFLGLAHRYRHCLLESIKLGQIG